MPKTLTAADIAANVRAELARRAITQGAVAEALGLSQPQVSARLRGSVMFRIDELLTIAALLDLPPVALFGVIEDAA